MQALVIGDGDAPTILRHNIPIPTPGTNQILVRVAFAGQNPPDLYALDPIRSASYRHVDNILGSDFAGTVMESNAENVPIGASVCGWVPGNASQSGSFAEYVVCDANLVIKCPTHILFEEMAALPFSFFTALHGLTCGLRIRLEEKQDAPVLVWGAGTACGQYASQILAQSSIPFIAVASAQSIRDLKGALAVYSRENGLETITAIKSNHPTIRLALDCHGSIESVNACVQVINSGHLHTLLPTQPSPEYVNSKVDITFALMHSMLGKHSAILNMLPRSPTEEEFAHDYAIAKSWASFDQGKLYQALQTKSIRPIPVRRWPISPYQSFGLAGVQEALQLTDTSRLTPGKIVHAIDRQGDVV